MKILWSTEALNDIEEIYNFIEKDSKYYAINFVTKIIKSIDLLEAFPEIGRIVPEYDDEQLREIIYRNYRIVYRISNKYIEIVTIFNGSKLLD
jgi:toxin ParE1/3/4